MNHIKVFLLFISIWMLIGYNQPQGKEKAALADSLFPAGGTYNSVSTITLPDGTACDNFGGVIFNGLFLATQKGYYPACPARDLSKVYLYQKNAQGWVPFSRIETPDLDLNSPMAGIIGIDDSRLVILYSEAGDSFSMNRIVVIYRFDGIDWVEEQRLSPPNLEDDLGFGNAAAISGSTLFVAATYARVNGLDYKGAIYAYRYDGNTWVLSQKISDAADYRTYYFGNHLLLRNDILYVGFPNRFDGGWVNVYQFANDQWTLAQVITSANVNYQAYFGSALALDDRGNTLVIGAMEDGVGDGAYQGSAIVFERVNGAWVEKAKLVGLYPSPYDGFGGAVAVQGDDIFIGAYRHKTGIGGGAVYVFHKPVSGWQSVPAAQELKTPNSGFFGSGIYPDGNSLLIASPYESVNGQVWQGAIHIFHRGISHSLLEVPVYEGEKDIPLSFILDSPSEQPVTIAIRSNNPAVSLSPDSLTFQPGQWDQPQNFLLSFSDNCTIEVSKSIELTFNVTSDDMNYDHMQISPMIVLVAEKFVLKTNPMTIKEGQSQENMIYIVKPSTQPVSFSAEENTWVQMNPNPFTFQTNDQITQFNVIALDDQLILGDQLQVLKLTSSSQDPFFEGIFVCLPIHILENDHAIHLPFLSN